MLTATLRHPLSLAMNKPSAHRLSIAFVLAIVAVACGITGSRGNGDDNYFSAFAGFGPDGWLYSEPVTMRVDTLRDSIARHGILLLSLRHADGYEYSNLWLELSYTDEDSAVVADTLNIILADTYGRWNGRGTGPSLQITDTVSENFILRRGMELKLRHIMRLDTLTNIERVGLVYIPKD